jgi:aerobic carbon-monoxide dehydrogenase large subunit
VGSALYGANHVAVAAQEGCTVRLEPSGTLICHTSSTDQGQGVRTAIAQIVADVFGLAAVDAIVRAGDTSQSPVGGGTWASRGLAIGGQAALLAAEDLRRAVLDIGQRVLKSQRVRLQDGRVCCAETGRSLPLADIANIGYFRQHELAGSPCPELSATRHYVPVGFPYIVANGMQGCSVEVDVETGLTRLLGFWVVHDCGRVINPMLVDEQIRGGVVQAIGGALFEHCQYSTSGQLSNGTLAEYLVPMACEMPDIEIAHVESIAAETALGAKGVGEAGAIGAGAAVWNAVNDALHPLGAAVTRQPFTPDRILSALRAAVRGTDRRAAEPAEADH